MSHAFPFDPETGEILATPFQQEAPVLSNVPDFTVSSLSLALKRTLEESYALIRVRGEISRISSPQSGHTYFDLKDHTATLSCIIWRSTLSRLKFKPLSGTEVIATGKITTFPGQSKYQLIIETLEGAGAGALMALLEERRLKLQKEGLFETSRKKSLPFLPRIIGVITSPTGAVIRDILHRLEDRFPRRVLLWPVRVQGETCAQEVSTAISGFNFLSQTGQIPRPDLLIVARGGGSIEDLWGFQEESVVRAAANSSIPLISAIGHETDTTLLDYVADVRAPTPTAAAEMAVPVRSDLIERLEILEKRTHRAFERTLQEKQHLVSISSQKLPKLDDLLAFSRQRFDHASERLTFSLRAHTQSHRLKLSQATLRLSPLLLQQLFLRSQERLEQLREKAKTHLLFYALRRPKEKLTAVGKLLEALSYRSILQRGFALVRTEEGHPIRSLLDVPQEGILEIEWSDGKAQVFLPAKEIK